VPNCTPCFSDQWELNHRTPGVSADAASSTHPIRSLDRPTPPSTRLPRASTRAGPRLGSTTESIASFSTTPRVLRINTNATFGHGQSCCSETPPVHFRRTIGTSTPVPIKMVIQSANLSMSSTQLVLPMASLAPNLRPQTDLTPIFKISGFLPSN
jgi:hypothetical protein